MNTFMLVCAGVSLLGSVFAALFAFDALRIARKVTSIYADIKRKEDE